MRKITAAEIGPLITETNGNVAAIARRFGCARSTIQSRIDKSPGLKALLEDARQGMVDIAESALYKRIYEGDITAIIFFLKTRGKDRGYVERQEFTGKDGGDFGLAVKRLSVADEADIDDEIKRLEGDVDPDEEAPLRAEAYRLPPGFGEPV
jgi:hypothetical protein